MRSGSRESDQDKCTLHALCVCCSDWRTWFQSWYLLGKVWRIKCKRRFTLVLTTRKIQQFDYLKLLFYPVASDYGQMTRVGGSVAEYMAVFPWTIQGLQIHYGAQNLNKLWIGMAKHSKTSNLPSITDWRRFESRQAKNIKFPVPYKSAHLKIRP